MRHEPAVNRPLLNQMFNGINLGNGGSRTERSYRSAVALASRQPVQLRICEWQLLRPGGTLNTLNYTTALNPRCRRFGAGVNGMVLRAQRIPG